MYKITVAEMNNIAANIVMGRNRATIQWRSDFEALLRLGEQIAIRVLRDQKPLIQKYFSGFPFTNFDGGPNDI